VDSSVCRRIRVSFRNENRPTATATTIAFLTGVDTDGFLKDSYVSYFVATIYYSYSVNNEYYSGNFERAFLREVAANRFVNRLKDPMIFVRSNPPDPEKSAILKQDQPTGWPA
jgi:hypothetical protein